MNRLITLQHLVRSTHCKVRLKVYHADLATEWSNGFGLPVKGYIEVAGPEQIKDVEWVEFDPVIVTYIGRLVPPKVSIVIDDIIRKLSDEAINYEIVKGIIRIHGSELR